MTHAPPRNPGGGSAAGRPTTQFRSGPETEQPHTEETRAMSTRRLDRHRTIGCPNAGEVCVAPASFLAGVGVTGRPAWPGFADCRRSGRRPRSSRPRPRGSPVTPDTKVSSGGVSAPDLRGAAGRGRDAIRSSWSFPRCGGMHEHIKDRGPDASQEGISRHHVRDLRPWRGTLQLPDQPAVIEGCQLGLRCPGYGRSPTALVAYGGRPIRRLAPTDRE